MSRESEQFRAGRVHMFSKGGGDASVLDRPLAAGVDSHWERSLSPTLGFGLELQAALCAQARGGD